MPISPSSSTEIGCIRFFAVLFSHSQRFSARLLADSSNANGHGYVAKSART
jgi:hypothetical protein